MLDGNCAGLCVQSSSISAESAWMAVQPGKKEKVRVREREQESERERK